MLADAATMFASAATRFADVATMFTDAATRFAGAATMFVDTEMLYRRAELLHMMSERQDGPAHLQKLTVERTCRTGNGRDARWDEVPTGSRRWGRPIYATREPFEEAVANLAQARVVRGAGYAPARRRQTS